MTLLQQLLDGDQARGACADHRDAHSVSRVANEPTIPPEKQKALPKEGSQVASEEIAGAGFEPATFGL